MIRRVACAACAASVFAITANASAAEPEPNPTEPHAPAEASSPRTLLVEPVVGAGAPLGLAGGSLVLAPLRYFAIHGGAGAGVKGLQIGAGARGRAPIGKTAKTALSFGAGWSMGATETDGASALFAQMGHRSAREGLRGKWSQAQLVNLDLALEHDFDAFVLRPFAGFGYVVGGKGGVSTQTDEALVRLIPFAGIALQVGLL
jgi:hypothetical protein